MPNFKHVSNQWGEVYIVGGGPSLRGFNFDRLAGKTVLAVNDAVAHIPWASTLFSLDLRWIRERRSIIQSFLGEVYLGVPEDYDFSNSIPNVTYLRRIRDLPGFSNKPYCVHMGGGNSGFGALNLAWLKKVRRIVLLGFDFSGAHWHNGYSWDSMSNRYVTWARLVDDTAKQFREAGIEVYNAISSRSRKSLLTQFHEVSLSSIPLQEVGK